MLKQDLGNQGAAPVTTVKWPSGADSIREELSKDLIAIFHKYMEMYDLDVNGHPVQSTLMDPCYFMLCDFAEKYAARNFFDR